MIYLTLALILLGSVYANEVVLVRRWKTTLEDAGPMGYSSASFAIAKDTLYVANGANVGNAVLKFDLEGNFLGQYPGWYNWPVDMVLGGPGEDQVLLSAIGAMGDDLQLRFGMLMYTSDGEFFHGYHEEETGLKRPYGLANIPGSQGVVVCDWDNNRTVELAVDWEQGTVVEAAELAVLPYPFRIALTRERMVVASHVCCEEWHKTMTMVTVYQRGGVGEVLATIKELPTGETITQPSAVAAGEEGDLFLLSDDALGTVLFGMDGTYLGPVEGLEAPVRSLLFHSGLLYSLTCEMNAALETEECFINVFTYSWASQPASRLRRPH